MNRTTSALAGLAISAVTLTGCSGSADSSGKPTASGQATSYATSLGCGVPRITVTSPAQDTRIRSDENLTVRGSVCLPPRSNFSLGAFTQDQFGYRQIKGGFTILTGQAWRFRDGHVGKYVDSGNGSPHVTMIFVIVDETCLRELQQVERTNVQEAHPLYSWMGRIPTTCATYGAPKLTFVVMDK